MHADEHSQYEPAPSYPSKLAENGHEAIVVPHGNTWGFYTPPGSSWDKQLVGAQHDPSRQRLIEIYSGHGNSEQYRDWREVGTQTIIGQTVITPAECQEVTAAK